MKSGLFVDTNVIVYANDTNEASKQARAIALLDALQASGRGYLSTQVLGETYLSLQRLRIPYERADARLLVESMWLSWSILPVVPRTVAHALRAAERYQLHHWDAQIWATAYLGDCAVVLTEDVPGVEIIAGVRLVNPFLAGFSLESYLAG